MSSIQLLSTDHHRPKVNLKSLLSLLPPPSPSSPSSTVEAPPPQVSLKSILSLLHRCSTSPTLLPQLHAQILKFVYSHHPFLLTRLVHTYLSASLLSARKPSPLPSPTLRSCSCRTIPSSLSRPATATTHRRPKSTPSPSSPSSIAAAPPPTPRQILKSAHSHHPFLLTRLAHTYLSASLLPAAQTILNSFPNPPPLFLWSEAIKAYSRNGRFRSAIDVFHRMLSLGVCPNEFTFTFVLPACAGARDADEGRRIHEDVLSMSRMGSMRKQFPYSTKCINLEWNLMRMVGVLQACSHLGTLQRGKWIHEQVLQANMDINIHLGAALITTYARCASINDARRMLDGMPERNLICWTAIIFGYGMHGLAKDAEVLFNEMVACGVKPDGVAFVGLLTGFSHKTMVEKGREYFGRMVGEYEIKPTLEHLSCMVDMLAIAVRLDEGNMDMKHDAGVASN
ncbi:hypothetical protein ZIOFF_072143 [Zingiber officinale]|uniref:Pentatricopeptide repeat-containing protein n=1 Tax=Zingiber officinale TaxID=94328 RepID=A0A8J5C2R5_ZINOF|nr:hypothetical protein ZIOFF_072143 [Zingiber officinale]